MDFFVFKYIIFIENNGSCWRRVHCVHGSILVAIQSFAFLFVSLLGKLEKKSTTEASEHDFIVFFVAFVLEVLFNAVKKIIR